MLSNDSASTSLQPGCLIGIVLNLHYLTSVHIVSSVIQVVGRLILVIVLVFFWGFYGLVWPYFFSAPMRIIGGICQNASTFVWVCDITIFMKYCLHYDKVLVELYEIIEVLCCGFKPHLWVDVYHDVGKVITWLEQWFHPRGGPSLSQMARIASDIPQFCLFVKCTNLYWTLGD